MRRNEKQIVKKLMMIISIRLMKVLSVSSCTVGELKIWDESMNVLVEGVIGILQSE